jgi:hypothetical protein
MILSLEQGALTFSRTTLRVMMFEGATVVEFPGDGIFNHFDIFAVRLANFLHSGQIFGSPLGVLGACSSSI